MKFDTFRSQKDQVTIEYAGLTNDSRYLTDLVLAVADPD
jgi:hypothetical protein